MFFHNVIIIIIILFRLFSRHNFSPFSPNLKALLERRGLALLRRRVRSGAPASREQMSRRQLQAYLAGRGGSALPATSQEERW